MESRDNERLDKLCPKSSVDRSSSAWPISHVGWTGDVPDKRRDRAVSTSSISWPSGMIDAVSEDIDCEALAPSKSEESSVPGRSEDVVEDELKREVCEAGCKTLDLAINRERKLGRGGGASSSSSSVGTGSDGIYGSAPSLLG